jgi:hypothetical protein
MRENSARGQVDPGWVDLAWALAVPEPASVLGQVGGLAPARVLVLGLELVRGPGPAQDLVLVLGPEPGQALALELVRDPERAPASGQDQEPERGLALVTVRVRAQDRDHLARDLAEELDLVGDSVRCRALELVRLDLARVAAPGLDLSREAARRSIPESVPDWDALQ